MQTSANLNRDSRTLTPWNKGKLIGQKPPLKLAEIWTVRTRRRMAGKKVDVANDCKAITNRPLEEGEGQRLKYAGADPAAGQENRCAEFAPARCLSMRMVRSAARTGPSSMRRSDSALSDAPRRFAECVSRNLR
jgi:hypothetical protein